MYKWTGIIGVEMTHVQQKLPLVSPKRVQVQKLAFKNGKREMDKATSEGEHLASASCFLAPDLLKALACAANTVAIY